MTMATDYLLGVWAVGLSLKLLHDFKRTRQQAVRLWGLALLATSLASFFGGTYHGFILHLSGEQQWLLWKATVYSIGLASMCLLAGSLMAFVPRPVRSWLLAATLVKFLVYATWMATHDDFRYVIHDYAPAMIVVLLLAAIAVRRRKEESASWLIAGILVSFLAAGVQQSGFRLHKYFNHNDLYHIVQLGAVYLLYRGAALLKDC